MGHLREGQLRAFYDGELDDSAHEQVRQHLVACVRCTEAARHVQARGERIDTCLNGMEAQAKRVPVVASAARHRFDAYLAQQQNKETAMRQNVFSRRYRPAWVMAALVLVFAISFSFAPVRTLAGNLLALFRVQQIQFVEINPANLSDEEAVKEAMRKFETVLEDQIAIEVDGDPQTVDAATAREQAGYPVRFPADLEGELNITLRPGVRASMQIDLPRVRALLRELGYDDVDLPNALDGAEVSAGFETVVAAAYGTCVSDGEKGTTLKGTCTEFVQLPAPEVSAPPELDVDQLGQAYLQLLGLSATEAARLGERLDWTTTLVVPLPESANLRLEDVSVDGVTGTLIRPPSRGQYGQEYLLTWVKDGIVYALHGTGSTGQALSIANSLQ